MIKNYFKIAFRNLQKNKTTAIINITGLAIGLTCCLLMVLYIQHELSYDKFQNKGGRIARVIMEYKFNNSGLSKGNFTSTKLFPAFKRSFPEVEDGVRMSGTDEIVKYGDKIFNERSFIYADSTFFNIFSFKLLQGNAATVLKAPRMIVLTASTAQKYFGEKNPVGETVMVGADQQNYLVTGVVEDCPSNSQIKFDLLASFSSLGQAQEETYFNANYTTYLLLRSEKDIASLQKKIGPFMQKEVKTGYDPGTYINFELEPYTKIHLYSPFDSFDANSSISYIYIVGAIALLILVIACFTYINLSTARSVERAKEVGIRKVSGAFKGQLFWQFIGESVFITTIAAIISLILAFLLLPSFNQLASKKLSAIQFTQPFVVISFITISAVIALLAGSYPALVLSKFQPVKVLKGTFKNASSGVWLRKSLLVFQFTISVFLIVATVIIKNQLTYIQGKKLGYDRDHVIVMGIDQQTIDKIDIVKAELKTDPAILAVSKAQSTPVRIMGGYSMSLNNESGSEMNVKACPVDDEYVKANSLELIAGTGLTRQELAEANQEDYAKNYYHYIINESAARALGWKPQDAIGKKMYLGSHRPGEVKAVVRDFHFASMHSAIEPLVLFPGGWGNQLIIKTSGQNLTSTISFLETKMKALAPHRPFEYRFMDEEFNKLYQSELRMGKVFSIFSAIAILLACLGLFGMSAYAAQQRMKEIGVRKVLGASISSIIFLLSANFIRLICIAFLIGAPVTWLVMRKWLQDFAYRITIGWWVFAVAASAILFIAFLIISIQSAKAALANPVKSLRTE